jgi:acetoin utilization deacetylase AcuC-like enzyme
MTMNVGIGRDPLFLEHLNGPAHPERPERLLAIEHALRGVPFADRLVPLEVRDAVREELERVHAPAYLERLERSSGRPLTIFDADTQANEQSYNAAVRAAGAAICAVEAAFVSLPRSFVLCRPPGHHAERARAMGFCFLNNAAVAAAHALAAGRAKRVAIIDWDVHHGNGTAHIFASRRDVLYLSIHQSPHYPGSGYIEECGEGEGEGFTVNVPLPAGCGDADYLQVLDSLVRPILRSYAPDILLISAGFDPHANDPLAGMNVTADGFTGMTSTLVELAELVAGGRIVHLLEGGYDLEGLGEGVRAVLGVLTMDSPRADGEARGGPEMSAVGRAALEAVLAHQRAYWPV